MELLKSTVDIEFYCENLPGSTIDGNPHCMLALQKGTEAVQQTPADNPTAFFELEVEFVLDTVSGKIDYKGPYVHGKLRDRFVYFCWGFESIHGWQTVRRAKFYLDSITPMQWNAAMQMFEPVRVRFNMTGPKDQPLTASIKPTHFEVLA